MTGNNQPTNQGYRSRYYILFSPWPLNSKGRIELLGQDKKESKISSGEEEEEEGTGVPVWGRS